MFHRGTLGKRWGPDPSLGPLFRTAWCLSPCPRSFSPGSSLPRYSMAPHSPFAAPPSPFPADFKNVSIVGHYIKDRTRDAQFIIISLRNNMFELADRLVGIYKTDNSTKTVTINPAEFTVGGAATTAGGGEGQEQQQEDVQMTAAAAPVVVVPAVAVA